MAGKYLDDRVGHAPDLSTMDMAELEQCRKDLLGAGARIDRKPGDFADPSPRLRRALICSA